VSGSPGVLALSALAITTLVVVRFVLFRAGCSLAEAGEPGWVRSAALVLAVLLVSLGFVLTLAFLFPATADQAGSFGSIALAAVAVAAAAAVAAVLYAWLLPTTLRRGATVAAAELLLSTLAAALVAGVVLVVVAGLQLRKRPEPPKVPTAMTYTRGPGA
jgi:phage tail sheath gpL-like